jgi:excisionase family DNA binding protein
MPVRPSPILGSHWLGPHWSSGKPDRTRRNDAPYVDDTGTPGNQRSGEDPFAAPWRPPVSDPLLYTPEEAAERLRIARHRIFDLLRTGEIESIKLGRSRRIPAVALIEFVERQRAEARQATAGGAR